MRKASLAAVSALLVAVFFFACGETLTVDGDPNKVDGGLPGPPTDGVDGSSPNGAEAGEAGGEGTEGCKLAHDPGAAGKEDATFNSVPLAPKNIPSGQSFAFGLAVLADGRLAIAGENNLRCDTGTNGTQTILSFVNPNGDSPASLGGATCPTTSPAGVDNLRGITSVSSFFFLLGRQGTAGASANGFSPQGTHIFKAQLSDSAPTGMNEEWTAYGGVVSSDGRSIVMAGGNGAITAPTKGFVERFAVQSGNIAVRDEAFSHFTRSDTRGFRAIAPASFGYVVAGTTASNQAVVIKLNQNGKRVPFNTLGELVHSQPLGNVVAVAADGPDVLVVLTGAVMTHLLKLRADGEPDESFGTAGVTDLPDFTINEPFARGSVLLRGCDGKWLIGGNKGSNPGSNPAVARVDNKGIIDLSFGKNGYAVMQPGPAGTTYVLTGMGIDANERLVTVSTSLNPNSLFVLHRLSL